MKSGIVSMLLGAVVHREMGGAGRVRLVFVPDEETGGADGSERMSELGLMETEGCLGAIVGEPSFPDIWYAARGAFTVKVTVAGKPAHVGLHYTGINAFEHAHQIVSRLWDWRDSVASVNTNLRIEPEAARSSIALIGGTSSGGTNFNIVPDEFSFTIDRRPNPDEDYDVAMVGFEYSAESIVSRRHISSGVWLRQGDQIEKVESGSFQSDGAQRMYGITELAAGTLAVIGHRYAAEPADEHPRITFWVSTDRGVTWQNVRQPEVEDATLNPKINDVCLLPTGGAIGIGGHGVDGATPAVWLTEDGKSWEAAVVDGDPFGGGFNTLNRCEADGDRTYVVGAHGSPHSAAVWTTTDGRNFERVDHGAFPEFTSVSDIEVFADGRIWIVGPIWAPAGDGASTIVEMDDTGAITKLERLDTPEFMGPTGFANVWSITGSADNIILLGDSGDSVAIWRAPLP